MLLTESEAEKKCCPFAKLDLANGAEIFLATRCVASACMALRWSDTSMKRGDCGLMRQTDVRHEAP